MPRSPPQPRVFKPQVPSRTGQQARHRALGIPAIARMTGWRKRIESDLCDLAQDSILARTHGTTKLFIGRRLHTNCSRLMRMTRGPCLKRRLKAFRMPSKLVLPNGPGWLVRVLVILIAPDLGRKSLLALDNKRRLPMLGSTSDFATSRTPKLSMSLLSMSIHVHRVRDRDYNAAILQDLGSSPATHAASRAADFHGCPP